jgi:flagellar assembly factor FliW
MTATSTKTKTTTTSADGTDLPVIEFVLPIPGFSILRRFVLVKVDDSEMIYSMRSVDDPSIRFMVLTPGRIFPDYVPEIDDATLALLGVTSSENVLVYAIVSTGDTVAESTANLLAPIVVDARSRKAVQVVLSGTELPIRAPLVPA